MAHYTLILYVLVHYVLICVVNELYVIYLSFNIKDHCLDS